MNHLLHKEDFLSESKLIFDIGDLRESVYFTHDQISEAFQYLDSDDEALLEAWYNTILDFAALIPVIGSVAEGINLVSYARQGEHLLAALCAIGLIPIFGQYIGAGGTLLIKALGRGAKLGEGILKPLVNLVARFFPKIVAFFKSPNFLSKFSGIGVYVGKMIEALKSFVTTGGAKIGELAKDASKIKALKKDARNIKQGVKITDWIFGSKGTLADEGGNKIPVPKDAYLSYQGVPLNNIRPYTDMEISQAAQSQDWSQYLA
jgi:hypothetical protein